MKIFIAALLIFFVTTVTAGNNNSTTTTSNTTTGSDDDSIVVVVVGAYCDGVDSSSLAHSPKALAYAAKALEVTFNHVYDAIGPDSVRVITNGPPLEVSRVVANTNVKADKNNNNSSSSSHTTNNKIVVHDGNLRGNQDDNRGCTACPVDDDRVQTMMDSSTSTTATGLAFTMVVPDSSSPRGGYQTHPLHEDWEVKFGNVLSKAPYTALAGVHKCQLIVDEEATQEVIDSVTAGACPSCSSNNDNNNNGGDDVVPMQPVFIVVKCDEEDFTELSFQTLVTTARVLQDTYNAIHETMDGGNGDGYSSLEGVQLNGSRFPFSSESSIIVGGSDRGSGSGSDSGCTNCPNDDSTVHNLIFKAISIGSGGLSGRDCRGCPAAAAADDDEDGASATSDKALQAWEDLFVANLRQDSKSGENVFENLGQCKIAMATASSAF